jgi:hypothetical protein
MAGVENPQRAKINWMLNCQECHKPDARGSENGAPNMAGQVSKFLSVEGGRAFLVRVPGVAHAPLEDAQLAELLNWSLYEFDPAHLPDAFVPYSAEEIATHRSKPLASEATEMRKDLLSKFHD